MKLRPLWRLLCLVGIVALSACITRSSEISYISVDGKTYTVHKSFFEDKFKDEIWDVTRTVHVNGRNYDCSDTDCETVVRTALAEQAEAAVQRVVTSATQAAKEAAQGD